MARNLSERWSWPGLVQGHFLPLWNHMFKAVTQTSHFTTIPPEASPTVLYIGHPGSLHRISAAYLVYFCLCSLCQFHYKHAYVSDTWQYVFWDVMLCQCTSCFLMFWRIILPAPVGSSSPRNLGLLHPDHEGITVLKNTGELLNVPEDLSSSEYQIKKLKFLMLLK
jgi:hypothetical protein